MSTATAGLESSGTPRTVREQQQGMSALGASFNRLARPVAQREPSAPFDREYWLAHCEGYRVESPGGRVGLVEEVRPVAGSERPESLAVLAGMRGRRRLIIPVSEVAAIVPHAERVFLKPGASIVRSESLNGR